MFEYLAPGSRALCVATEVPPVPGCKRLVCVADTHLKEIELPELPKGDILIHAGDILFRSGSSGQEECDAAFAHFCQWLEKMPHRDAVVIGGNHDVRVMEKGKAGVAAAMPPNRHYLENDVKEVQGIRFFGSPHSIGTSRNYAWQYPKPDGLWEELRGEAVDVVVSHGPIACRGNGDVLQNDLFAARAMEAGARLNICGHLHWAYGLVNVGSLACICVSSLDGKYRATRRPVVVDFPVAAHVVAACLSPPFARSKAVLCVTSGDAGRYAKRVATLLKPFFEVVQTTSAEAAAEVLQEMNTGVFVAFGSSGCSALQSVSEGVLTAAHSKRISGAVRKHGRDIVHSQARVHLITTGDDSEADIATCAYHHAASSSPVSFTLRSCYSSLVHPMLNLVPRRYCHE